MTTQSPRTAPDPRLRGAFTAIVTPWTEGGRSIDLDRLRSQVEFQARGEDGRGGVRGIVVSGTTGESPTLEHDEYAGLVRAAVAVARPLGLIVIAGTGSNSTAHAVALQKEAAALGADYALSVNPYYNKPTQEGLYRHFATQADAAGLGVMLYNIPGRTGVALAPETVARLAAHPRIVSVKEATGSTDSCGEIAWRCPGLAVLSGDDGMTLPFMSVGAVGVVSVVSNLLPGATQRMVDEYAAGRHAAALETHRRVMGLIRALFGETNPIPVKAAMRLLGRDNGQLRLPMTEASEATVSRLRQALPEAGLRL